MKLEDLIAELSGSSSELTADGLEGLVEGKGREVLRSLLAAAVELRSLKEQRRESVTGDDGVERNHVRPLKRSLTTQFGDIDVSRLAYRQRDVDSRMPLDAELSLPEDLYSYRVRRRIAEFASEGSFGKAGKTFSTTTGVRIPHRQVEELAARAAKDFEPFYATREVVPTATTDLLVLQFDAKGVIMRKEALREETKKKAKQRRPRLDKRRSKGEQANLRRMAQLAVVFDQAPFVRSPYDVVYELHKKAPKPATTKRPRAQNKYARASVEHDSVEVIVDGFQEALRRDPERKRRWVVLVDGNLDQLDTIKRTAKQMGVEITIIVDVIHVLEYVWKAGLCFEKEGSKELEEWVEERFLKILQGNASDVAAGLGISATKRNLESKDRAAADKCAEYLLKYKRYLRYDEALSDGLPIATGVVEGACRRSCAIAWRSRARVGDSRALKRS